MIVEGEEEDFPPMLLAAVGFEPPDGRMDVAKVDHQRALVLYLEELCVRSLHEKARGALLREVSDEAWPAAFQKYLDGLDTESKLRSYDVVAAPADALRELLRLAISRRAETNAAGMARAVALRRARARDAARCVRLAADPDAGTSTAAFCAAVADLGERLMLPPSTDPLDTLRAAALVLDVAADASTTSNRFGASNLEEVEKVEDEEEMLAALDALPAGLGGAAGTADARMARAVRLAHVLHLREQRRLQSAGSALLAEMQSFTANPDQDASLGRVGR